MLIIAIVNTRFATSKPGPETHPGPYPTLAPSFHHASFPPVCWYEEDRRRLVLTSAVSGLCRYAAVQEEYVGQTASDQLRNSSFNCAVGWHYSSEQYLKKYLYFVKLVWKCMYLAHVIVKCNTNTLTQRRLALPPLRPHPLVDASLFRDASSEIQLEESVEHWNQPERVWAAPGNQAWDRHACDRQKDKYISCRRRSRHDMLKWNRR